MTLLAMVTIAGITLTPVQFALALLPIAFVLYTFALHTGYSKANPLVWSWVPHLRSAALFGADPNTFLRKCKEQYGKIFTVNLAGRKMTFITDPACFMHILKAREGLSFSAVAGQVAIQAFGVSPEFVADRDHDIIAHQQYAKYLGGANLDELTESFGVRVQEWCHTYFEKERTATGNAPSGAVRTVGLYDLTTRAIFASATRALLGDLLVDEHPQNEKLDETFCDNFFTPTKLLGAFQAFDNALPLLVGGLPQFLVRKGIEARVMMIRALSAPRADQCAWMDARADLYLRSPPTMHADMPHQYGGAQLGTLWAAQGNTIPTSTWVLFNLVTHPTDLERVTKQVRKIISDAAKNNPQQASREKWRFDCSRESLKAMTLLDCAINESLRLAAGSIMMRRAMCDLVLDLPTGPLEVKKGANLAIYPWLAHHDPTLYPRPEEFVLDRWANMPVDATFVIDIHGNQVPGAFMPFGGGMSMCPARHFARNEIKMFVACLLQAYDLQPDAALKHPGYMLSRAGLGIYPPAKEIQIKYTLRECM